MSIVTKIAALLLLVKRQELEELSPSERERLAQLCRHVAGMAEAKYQEPKAGVLVALRRQQRDE